MSLTPLQRHNLKIFQTFRDREMTQGGIFLSNIRVYLIMTAFYGLLGGLCLVFFGLWGASLVWTAGASAILRDLGYMRRSAALWPILRQVLDWEKVEELQRQDQASGDAGTAVAGRDRA